MEDRAPYTTRAGEAGVEAIMATAMAILKEGRQPKGALIRERLGWSPSQSTIIAGLEGFYAQIGASLVDNRIELIPKQTSYFTITADVEEGLSMGQEAALSYCTERNSTYLSANVRLCAVGKAVMLDTEKLALEYAAAAVAVFKKRGQTVTFTVKPITEVGAARQAGTESRIENDSLLVRGRISQDVMAPNCKPSGCA